MALTATQLQEVAAITTQHINDAIPDLFTQANGLYTKMYDRKNYVSGGTFIQMPIAGVAELGSQGFITGTAADCVLQLNYRDVTGQCTDCVLTTAAADRLYIDVNDYDGATAAGTNAGIAIVGGDHIEIVGRYMDGNFAVGGIDIRTTATTDLFVHDFKYFRTRNAADIFLVDTITASTGQVGPNIYLRLNDNAANITEAITGATFVQHLPISVVNLAAEVGMTINTTASTDA